MNNKTKIKAVARSILADSVQKTPYKWKGYDVYIPIYFGDPAVGLPSFILANGDDVVRVTGEEAFAIIDKYYSKDIG